MPVEKRPNLDRASVNMNLLHVYLKPPINGFSNSLEPYWHGEQNNVPKKKLNWVLFRLIIGLSCGQELITSRWRPEAYDVRVAHH